MGQAIGAPLDLDARRGRNADTLPPAIPDDARVATILEIP